MNLTRWCALRAWALLGAAALLAGHPAGAAEQSVLTIDSADLVATLGGNEIARGPIKLPLHWDVAFRGSSGAADLQMRFDRPAAWVDVDEPFTLFIARLGAAYEIHLNGVLLAREGALQVRGGPWSAKHPVSINVPAQILQARNELHVRVRTDAGRRSGLSALQVGPASLVTPIVVREERIRVVLPQAAAVLSLLVALFCAVLWWQQRDTLYAWAGLAEALWAVAVADTVLEAAPLPWPWWGLVVLMVRALWSLALYAVVGEVFGRPPRAERFALLATVAAAPFVVVAAIAWSTGWPLGAYGVVTLLLWAVIVVRLVAVAWRPPRSGRVLLALAIVLILVAGARDAAASRWVAELYAESAWVKYVATLVAAAVMWVVSLRFRQARHEVVRLNESLVERVQQKERELRHSFERLAEVERTSAVLAERQRILRDMHDGVGANLATAVRQLEGGQAHPEDVAKTLRESMDHLKLTIDAMSLPPGDVNALLASLRYRLQPRIEAARLELEWAVEPLPPWPAGNDAAMRHLQFLLLEAISNALQHAQATRLVLSARASEAGIEVSLRDDGRGLPPGRSLRSLKERAEAMGTRLLVEPASPGTCVRVLLGPAPDAGQFGNDLAR